MIWTLLQINNAIVIMPPIRLFFNDTQTFLFLFYFNVTNSNILHKVYFFFSNYSHRIFNLLLRLEITRILV